MSDADAIEAPSRQVKRRKRHFHRPALYAKQEAAIFDPRRYSIIEASTKSGKTAGCIVWLIEEGLKNGQRGRNFWWVAPVSSQANIAFRRAMRALPQGTYFANITEKTITISSGAMLCFKSADHPDSLYGDDVYAAVIDEASRMKEEAWYAVRSTLTATKGPVRIIGNVKGRRNWFYKIARRAEAGDPRMGYHKIVAQDAVDAGVLDAEEIRDARDDMPEAVWRELYLAEASDDEGNPFGLEHIAKAMRDGLSTLQPKWWGWDLAKKRDWTVGIALDKNGHVCRFERFQKTPWPQTLERILALTGKTACLIDSTGVGDPIVDGLVAHKKGGPNFVGYQFTSPSKQRLMEGLAVAIQSRDIAYPKGSVIKDELDVFEYEFTRLGVRYTAPPGFHDDCVCALGLAVMCRGSADPYAYDVTQRWVRGEPDEEDGK